MTSHPKDLNAEQLRQLSEEVERIAGTLARLTMENAAADPRSQPAPGAGPAPDPTVEAIRALIRARRHRARYFPSELFADPAWDMMLDLFEAEISQRRVSVSAACLAAGVPPTTALRWLKALTDQGLFVRRADPRDARRVFVELSPETGRALRQYFADVGTPAGA